MTDIKTRLIATETIHFPHNTADDHSEDREVLVNPDGPEAAEYIAELERAMVEAAIPLEAMILSGADQTCSPELRKGVHDGVSAIRQALAPNETGAAS